LFENHARLVRERIPERVAHAQRRDPRTNPRNATALRAFRSLDRPDDRSLIIGVVNPRR